MKYSLEEFKRRMSYVLENSKKLSLSEQYGMFFLLTEDNEIVFNLAPLIKNYKNPLSNHSKDKE